MKGEQTIYDNVFLLKIDVIMKKVESFKYQAPEVKVIVVNLEKVPFPVGQRIMDFLSGTCYSLEGSIQRVAHNIFVIAPENVDISAHFKEELKTKGAIYSFNNKTAAR